MIQITYCVRIPLNNTRGKFHKKNLKNRFFLMVLYPFNEKADPLYFNIGPWGPHTSTLWGLFISCGCVDDQYLSPY